MDQVRAIAKVLWTQRFWVLSGLCAIIGTICWNMAAGDLDKEFQSRKSKIESAFRSVTTIKNEQNHPNDSINEGNRQQTKQQRDHVLVVWKDLYERQRKEVLFWPKSLGTRFIRSMDGKKFGDSISTNMRDRYMNYIKTRFDGLLEIVDALKIEDGRSSRSATGYGNEYSEGGRLGNDDEVEPDYLVEWLDQEKVRQKLTFITEPTDIQVWITQEDLWVYETLLNVIAKTNQSHGATRPDNAPIRTIVSMQVGSEASSQPTGQVYIPQVTAGAEGGGVTAGYGGEYGSEYGGGGYGGDYGGGGYGGDYGGDYGSEYGGRGAGGGDYGGRGAGASATVVNRYLDAQGNPDPGSSGSFGTTEFRQLPIRLDLFMDHRVLPRLLIECANAALPVEVKQIRINHEQSGTGFDGRSSSSRSRNAPEGAGISSIVIRGVVYIYNEPNLQELAIPGDEEADLADDSV